MTLVGRSVTQRANTPRHGSTQLRADRDLNDAEQDAALDDYLEEGYALLHGLTTSPCSPVLRSRSCVSHQRLAGGDTTERKDAA